jgi:hypothetical protein
LGEDVPQHLALTPIVGTGDGRSCSWDSTAARNAIGRRYSESRARPPRPIGSARVCGQGDCPGYALQGSASESAPIGHREDGACQDL